MASEKESREPETRKLSAARNICGRIDRVIAISEMFDFIEFCREEQKLLLLKEKFTILKVNCSEKIDYLFHWNFFQWSSWNCVQDNIGWKWYKNGEEIMLRQHENILSSDSSKRNRKE